MIKLNCQRCNKEFEAKRIDAKYCKECQKIKHKEYDRIAQENKRFAGECLVCGKPIYKYSTRCKSCARKGERNSFWNGGKYKGFHGYVYIYMPEHPRAKFYHGRYVAEHQLVWEKSHNQYLPEGYIIHHLNGIKDDNRPENLVAIQPKYHSTGTLRELLQKRICELESQLTAPTT